MQENVNYFILWKNLMNKIASFVIKIKKMNKMLKTCTDRVISNHTFIKGENINYIKENTCKTYFYKIKLIVYMDGIFSTI